MANPNYGVCEKCGAEKVKNPKTGKIFCKEKCWLNNPVPGTTTKYVYPKKEQPDWDEIRARKETGMEWLNAKNNAAVLLSAAIQKGEIGLNQALDEYEKITYRIFSLQESDKGTNG